MKNGIRLLGHPVHPMLTDFPLALWSVSLLWDLAGTALGDPFWHALAYWCILAGLALAVPTVITGVSDYLRIPRGHAAEQIGLWHLAANFSAATAFLSSLLIRQGPGTPPGESLLGPVLLSALGCTLLMVGGWLGGHLVFRHGIGMEARARQPRTEESTDPRTQ